MSTAPEVFQRSQHQAVEGLPGVLSILNDILVYEEGETDDEATRDHDCKVTRSHGKMPRAKHKAQQREGEITQKRSSIDGPKSEGQRLKADPAKLKAVLEMPTPTDVAGI